MPTESIKRRLGQKTEVTPSDLRPVLNQVLADITAMRAAIVAITAKLDADGGVTDTNYAATCNPAALTTTA